MKKALIICIATLSCNNIISLPRRIAITIDDFPRLESVLFSPLERARKMIDACSETQCTVAFFCVGEGCTQPDSMQCLQLASDHGHFLANHSMTHSFTSAMTLQQLEQEILQVDTILEKYLMKRKWFRFPYLDCGYLASKGGSKKHMQGALALIKRLGHQDGYVSINTMDYRVNALLQNAIKQGKVVDYESLKNVYLHLLQQWCRHYYQEWQDTYQDDTMVHVLLLHANDLNALYLKDIITMLRSDGWDVVSPEMAFNSYMTCLPLLSLKKPPTLDVTTVNNMVQDSKAFPKN